ncbi:MAG: hypothetical protein V1838_02795 [Patescibacteria group bacterium]
MIAEIIPIIRLPRSQKYFDYYIPTNLTLQPGQAVLIPFRNRTITGIVNRLKKNPQSSNYKLRTILAMAEDNHLNLNNLKLINKLAEHYLTSPSIFAQYYRPKPIKRTGKVYQPAGSFGSNPPAKKYTKVNAFIRNNPESLIIHQHGEYLKVIASVAANTTTDNKQHLIILPDYYRLLKFITYLPPEWQQQAVIIHGQLSKTAYNQAYQSISQGKCKYIIGLKRSVFMPFKSLGSIWLINEDDIAHKQFDQNPRFHSRTVAQYLQTIYRAKMIYTAITPSLETWHIFKNKRKQIIQLGSLTPLNFISTKSLPGNASIITPPLERSINNVGQKEQALLLVNQKGEAAIVTCRDCQNVLLCHNCQHHLSVLDNNELHCKNCLNSEIMPTVCPRCHSTRLSQSGITVKAVARQLRSLFPERTIAIMDKNTDNQAAADLIIGTEYSLSQIKSCFKLSAIISLDQLLARPSFDAEFRTWQLINRLRAISRNCYIQTSDSDHHFIGLISQSKWSDLYKYIWDQRVQWHYPPSWRAVKLIFRHPQKKLAREKADQVYRSLKTSAPKNIEVITPHTLWPFRRGNKYAYGIFARWNKPVTDAHLRSWLSSLSDDWQIDIDPIDLN